jgi:hypothetical protein
MKKLILAVLLSITATSAMAQHYGYHGGYGYRGPVVVNNYHGGYRGSWVAPAVGGLIVGGIVGSALSAPYYAPAPVYVAPPVVYAPPPVIIQPAVPAAPYGYHYQNMLDPNCNCYKNVLVPN